MAEDERLHRHCCCCGKRSASFSMWDFLVLLVWTVPFIACGLALGLF